MGFATLDGATFGTEDRPTGISVLPEVLAIKHRALLVDADRGSAADVARWVHRAGYDVDTVDSLAEAQSSLEDTKFHLVVLNASLPDGNGLDLLEELGERNTDAIVISGNGTVDQAVDALKKGASEFLEKPIEANQFRTVLQKVGGKVELRDEISELRRNLQDLGAFGPLVGASTAMKEVYRLVERVAPTSAAVMIVGETGTGKEIVARTIHQLSRRKAKPFVPMNCGAIPTELVESELFGHEKGAFTGAVRARRGVFERAHLGTLFLDEVTEMPTDLQATLLRVLETGEYARVGGETLKKTDVRVISATNRDPHEAVVEEELREDLLYRLNVFPLHLPPLRERDGDVELLARHFLNELNREAGTRKRWSNAAIDEMESYDWPGNVRELQNVVERSYILAADVIQKVALPEGSRGAHRTRNEVTDLSALVGRSIKDVEKELILATLKAHGGNKKRTAETLGISLKTLYTRLNRYGV